MEDLDVRQRQREAVAKYPDLGVEGSPFYQAFLAEYRRKKETEPKFLATPDWPMTLADQVFNKTFRVKPRPAATPVAKEYFTLGSTKDEVLALQGTPDSISDSHFAYGGATVHFEDGRVTSWSNFRGELKVQLLPSR